MPEGDTIARVAAKLRRSLVGATLTGASLRNRGTVRGLVGQRVVSVEAIGKHMLIGVGETWFFWVHLGMHGRWRWVPESDLHSHRHASLVLATAEATAVCTRAMRAELRPKHDAHMRQILNALGPDLLREGTSLPDVVRRARQRDPSITLAELLLDQRVAAGIGNVYKSEALFVSGLDPRATVASASDTELTSLYRTASEMMRANLIPGARTTTFLQATGVRRPPSLARHWVYRRKGLPCLRCRATIERHVFGEHARSTYLCPRCQAAEK